jgi:hypothetical protein
MDEDLKKLKNRVAQWERDTDGMSYIITCDELYALIAAADEKRELVEALREKATEAKKLAADLNARATPQARFADPGLMRSVYAMAAKCDHFLEAADMAARALQAKEPT